VKRSSRLRPSSQRLPSNLRLSRRFGFDTEFVSEETFEPVLCLIQVATRERFGFDRPLSVRDLTPFWEVVCDPSVQVVMHAAGEDLRICLLQTGKLPGESSTSRWPRDWWVSATPFRW